MKQDLSSIYNNDELLEIGRKAIEDELVQWRNDGLSTMMRGNGFCIKSKDGTPSSIIRFGPEVGLKIALQAIEKHLTNKEEKND